ncbi:MAG: oligosaccharide flippase family protein [Bacteroidales bacterium]|nr:oligosaccharide flippase family protein [Bacteroidales bacterium]
MKLRIKIPKAHSGNEQWAINMVATLLGYLSSFGISFFLTPFIVDKLGATAYGFIGLSANVIGYTSLLTVAIDSMASRFITLKYHEGNYAEANKYLAATYYANLATAIFIVLILGILTVFLDRVFQVPQDLLPDVRALFVLTFVNMAISLTFNVYGMCLFIKNRLELGTIRTLVSDTIRVVLTVIAYSIFPVALWYIGLIAIICSAYRIITNYLYQRELTPELIVRKANFKLRYVWEMVSGGLWNILSSLSSMLNQGVDLLLANIFVSAYYMGIMSLGKSIPFIILSVCANLANTIHPEFIKYYADKRMDLLGNSLTKSIRVMGLFTSIPCAGLLAYGDIFYSQWLPGQDFMEIYNISSLTMLALIFTIPTQSIWYVFTMTNKVKISSLNLIAFGIINLICIISAMHILTDDRQKLYAIVIIQGILMIIRFTTFLPIYGAKVLGFSPKLLYLPLFKMVASTLLITAISLAFKHLCIDRYSWWTLILGASFTIAIGLPLNFYISLLKGDRKYIINKILRRPDNA